MLKLFGFEDPVAIAQLIGGWGAWIVLMGFGLLGNDWVLPIWLMALMFVAFLAYSIYIVRNERKNFRENREESS